MMLEAISEEVTPGALGSTGSYRVHGGTMGHRRIQAMHHPSEGKMAVICGDKGPNQNLLNGCVFDGFCDAKIGELRRLE